MSLAVRVPNWIGDGVMAMPTLRALQRAFPEDELVPVALDYLADLYLSVPGVARVVSLPRNASGRGLFTATRRIRTSGCRRGLLLPNSFGSALLFRLAGVEDLTGYARDGRSFLLRHPVAPPTPGGPFFRYYLHLAEALIGTSLPKVEDDDRLSVLPAEATAADTLLTAAAVPTTAPLLGIAPGAAFGAAKAWPVDRFHDLLRGMTRRHPGLRLLIFGSAAEREVNARLVTGIAAAVDFTGRLPLRRTIALMARCRAFLANDSGLMHVASSLRVPLVALFGPTDPTATAPLSRVRAVLHHPPECAPCRHRACPTDHRCMTAIEVEEVAAALDGMLAYRP